MVLTVHWDRRSQLSVATATLRQVSWLVRKSWLSTGTSQCQLCSVVCLSAPAQVPALTSLGDGLLARRVSWHKIFLSSWPRSVFYHGNRKQTRRRPWPSRLEGHNVTLGLSMCLCYRTARIWLLDDPNRNILPWFGIRYWLFLSFNFFSWEFHTCIQRVQGFLKSEPWEWMHECCFLPFSCLFLPRREKYLKTDHI